MSENTKSKGNESEKDDNPYRKWFIKMASATILAVVGEVIKEIMDRKK